MGHRGRPCGQKFQPCKTKPFFLWAPKSFITQIAKRASSSPALPNFWVLLVCFVILSASALSTDFKYTQQDMNTNGPFSKMAAENSNNAYPQSYKRL